MVRGLLEHLGAGTTDRRESIRRLDPEIFADPDIARREIDGVFGTVPFIAAHSDELPKSHDFVMADAVGWSFEWWVTDLRFCRSFGLHS